MAVAALALVSCAWQAPLSTLSRPALAVTPRATTPTAGFDFSGVDFSSPVQLLALAAFIPPSIQLGYAIEVSLLGPNAGPFWRIVKSDAVQKGPPMKRMKVEKAKVRGVRLSAAALEVTKSFKKQYPSKDLEVVWAALLKCYGNEQAAMTAVRANTQILNPAYSFPNTMLESKRVMLTVMSEAEAQEVMRLNPAVLQCGPSLDVLGANEIKSIAQFRNLGNTLIPPEVRTAVVAFFIGAIALNLSAAQFNDDGPLLAAATALKPVLGAGLASVFLFVIYGAANANRSVKDAEQRS